MSLIRTALVLLIGIALMPSDKDGQERLLQNASTAANWTVTFCDRNPGTCRNAANLWDVFKEKATFAGGLAYSAAISYVSQSMSGGTTQSPEARLAGGAYAQPSQGTLTPADLTIVWRGQSPKPGI